MKKENPKNNVIAENRKARHDYHLEQFFEAGIALEGWEVKSLRAGKAQIADSYVIIKNGAAQLVGSNFSPLLSASTHIKPDATRTRKLLLHQSELKKLIGATERQGYTIIPLNLHWSKKGLVKIDIALAKGKKTYDKRQSIKSREWDRDKQRLMKVRIKSKL